MDADQYVAQRVGRRGQAARFLQGGHAGPGCAVARDDVAQLLVELPHAGDLQTRAELSVTHENTAQRMLGLVPTYQGTDRADGLCCSSAAVIAAPSPSVPALALDLPGFRKPGFPPLGVAGTTVFLSADTDSMCA